MSLALTLTSPGVWPESELYVYHMQGGGVLMLMSGRLVWPESELYVYHMQGGLCLC